MSAFIFMSLGMIFGYFFVKKKNYSFPAFFDTSKVSLSSSRISIHKFIGKKTLTVDLSVSTVATSPNLKISIPVATVKKEIASKIAICYTEKSHFSSLEKINSNDDDDDVFSTKNLIKLNHKLITVSFNDNEVSIIPPFSSFPHKFKDLYICLVDADDDDKKFQVIHRIDSENLHIGLGWWPSEVEKAIKMFEEKKHYEEKNERKNVLI